MEIKEAIDILLDTDLTCYGYSKKEVDEAGNMGAEALEKQIPKKPIKHTELPNDRITYLCPTCNRLYWDKEFLSDWCSSCGQRFEIVEVGR